MVAPPDESINVRNEFTEPVSCGLYSTMQSHDYRTLRGRQIIRELRETQPDTLIIGSFIAARVYKGDIVSVLKLKPKPEKYGTDLPLISSDIFVIHLGD